LFRRTKTETPSADSATATKLGGKGRPTPTRREAEAAAKARAKAPRSRKEQMKAQRSSRSESSQKVRQAMKTGDERFLPPRDKGPVKRFIRDFVDSRFSFIELMVPLLIVTMVLGYSGNARLSSIGNSILVGTMLMVVIDMVFLRLRLRKELGRRFPDAPTKGTTYYAIMRALQMKFMRLPKPQVKIGQKLPDHYR
jgi:Flp pilus assembly protein TadB